MQTPCEEVVEGPNGEQYVLSFLPGGRQAAIDEAVKALTCRPVPKEEEEAEQGASGDV